MTESGVLGPTDLLRMPADARDGSVTLSVNRTALEANPDVAWQASGLTMLATLMAEVRVWPKDRMRWIELPEDCVIMTEPNDPRPLVADRLQKTETSGEWSVKDAHSFDPNMHGAAVIACNDGKLIGVLLVDGPNRVRVVALPIEMM